LGEARFHGPRAAGRAQARAHGARALYNNTTVTVYYLRRSSTNFEVLTRARGASAV
jgi:uncharacterized protein (DUF427 family)